MVPIHRRLVRFTWIFAFIFLPLETYVSFRYEGLSFTSFSWYAVNIVGVGVSLWGVSGLRRGVVYAPGLLAAGWGWTTATFWRGTNLRYWLASEGEQLSFGEFELWLAPIVTSLVAVAFVGSLVALMKSSERRG
jgi:hypothetical protein